MRSEYVAQSAIVSGLATVKNLTRENARKPRRYWGWNEKAIGLAFVLLVAGTCAESAGLMGAGCFVLCFGIRPYWR